MPEQTTMHLHISWIPLLLYFPRIICKHGMNPTADKRKLTNDSAYCFYLWKHLKACPYWMQTQLSACAANLSTYVEGRLHTIHFLHILYLYNWTIALTCVINRRLKQIISITQQCNFCCCNIGHKQKRTLNHPTSSNLTNKQWSTASTIKCRTKTCMSKNISQQWFELKYLSSSSWQPIIMLLLPNYRKLGHWHSQNAYCQSPHDTFIFSSESCTQVAVSQQISTGCNSISSTTQHAICSLVSLMKMHFNDLRTVQHRVKAPT